MPPARHTPERSCLACRRKRPQAELLRLTRTRQGWALLPGDRSGRGAYVCADTSACWQEKRLRRALRDQAPGIAAALAARAAAGAPASETDHREKPMQAQ